LDEIDDKLHEVYNNLQKPSIKHLLIYRLGVWLFLHVKSGLFILAYSIKDRLTGANKNNSPKENKEAENEGEEQTIQKSRKRRQKVNTKDEHLALNPPKNSPQKSDIVNIPVLPYELKPNLSMAESTAIIGNENKSQEWSNKEKSDLIKAIAKYPPGAVDRWEKIAEFVGRPANECIKAEKSIKSNFGTAYYTALNSAAILEIQSQIGASKKHSAIDETDITIRQAHESESNEQDDHITNSVDDSAQENANKSKTFKSDHWTQEQQIALEKALKIITKETPNRWERIAEMVPDKSKVI
jgi:hypothetical protein